MSLPEGISSPWPFFRNRLIDLTCRYLAYFSKAYVSGLCFREYPHNSFGLKYGTNVPPFEDPEIPIDHVPSGASGVSTMSCLQSGAHEQQLSW